MYRNMSHEFSGVIITIHDDAADAFIAHVFPPLDAKAPEQRAPLGEVEIQKALQERELNAKLDGYRNRLLRDTARGFSGSLKSSTRWL